MGPAARLSHGGAEICRGPLASRQEDRFGSAAQEEILISNFCNSSEHLRRSTRSALAPPLRSSHKKRKNITERFAKLGNGARGEGRVDGNFQCGLQGPARYCRAAPAL